MTTYEASQPTPPAPVDDTGPPKAAQTDSESEQPEGSRWLDPDSPVYPADLKLLVDGADYMSAWVRHFQALSGNGVVLHSAWRLTNVRMGDAGKSDLSFHALLRGNDRPTVYVRMSGHALSLTNLTELLRLRFIKVTGRNVYPYLDQSYASWLGSFHEKSTCFLGNDGVTVLLGSIDLTPRRKDTADHNRASAASKRPSHDIGIELTGPAAAQLMQTEIEMWSAASYFRDRVLWPYRTTKVSLPTSSLRQVRAAKRTAEAHVRSSNHVQLLRTIPKPTRERGWPYAAHTEHSLIDGYARAINNARHYIYVEDQYFTPNFGDAASGSWSWFDRFTPMDGLIGALRRGVQLIVVVPGIKPNGPGIRPMRDRAVDGLSKQALSAAIRPPVFAELHGLPNVPGHRLLPRGKSGRRRSGVHVHSKIIVCDDEFVIIGSANMNGRSFVNDVEMGVAVEGPFARQLRQTVWAEHLDVHHDDWQNHVEAFRAAVHDETGRLRAYRPQPGVTPPGKYLRWLWRLSEPKNE